MSKIPAPYADAAPAQFPVDQAFDRLASWLGAATIFTLGLATGLYTATFIF